MTNQHFHRMCKSSTCSGHNHQHPQGVHKYSSPACFFKGRCQSTQYEQRASQIQASMSVDVYLLRRLILFIFVLTTGQSHIDDVLAAEKHQLCQLCAIALCIALYRFEIVCKPIKISPSAHRNALQGQMIPIGKTPLHDSMYIEWGMFGCGMTEFARFPICCKHTSVQQSALLQHVRISVGILVFRATVLALNHWHPQHQSL